MAQEAGTVRCFEAGRASERQWSECRLVAEHALLAGPEPDDYEILVIAGREVHKPIDAASDPLEAPLANVVVEQRLGVARLLSLSAGHIPALRLSDRVELVPAWAIRANAGHARKLNGV